MQQWTGRFAPTPSGPLHFGSLVAALGSYLIAKQKQGLWLLRIEDLDPPREQPGAASSIIHTLERFGFQWDGEIVYQSQRQSLYHQALAELSDKQLTYRCDCSRKQVLQRNSGVYDGYCRERNLSPQLEAAVRIKFAAGFEKFNDQILDDCIFEQPEDLQDFVVLRRDNLFAYQLAVVVDDIEQEINHVVRGADILDSTPRQNFLYSCFQKRPPLYFHLPLVIDETGQKFSKSKLYPAISEHQASELLCLALIHLGQKVVPDLAMGTPSEVLQFAIKSWDISKVSKTSKKVTLQDLAIEN